MRLYMRSEVHIRRLYYQKTYKLFCTEMGVSVWPQQRNGCYTFACTRKSHPFVCSSKLVRQQRNAMQGLAHSKVQFLAHVRRTSVCSIGQTLVYSNLYVTPTVYILTINTFSNKCTSRCKVHNTHKSSYMFRHPSAIFRVLQRCRSPATNLCCVHSCKLH